MTEAEWLASDQPASMVFALNGKASRRKFLLFTAACCQFLGTKPSRSRSRVAEGLEAYADEAADFDDVVRLRATTLRFDGPVAAVFSQGLGTDADYWRRPSGQDHAAWQTASHVAGVATARRPGRLSKPDESAWRERKAAVKHLVLDVFGKTFAPPRAEPAWGTTDVVLLARGIYDDRAFDRLVILADALEEAGCDDATVLDHCRGHGDHVRGCWVVDLVLGKE